MHVPEFFQNFVWKPKFLPIFCCKNKILSRILISFWVQRYRDGDACSRILLEFCLKTKILVNILLQKQNSKQNFDFILGIEVSRWRCMFQNSFRILFENQNSCQYSAAKQNSKQNFDFILGIEVSRWRCMFQNSFRILFGNQNSCQYSAAKTKF